jgi:hypothetical protein
VKGEDISRPTIYQADMSTSRQVNKTTPHSTRISLNPIPNIPWGNSLTVAGQLLDPVTGAGLGGKTVTFTGTGAAKLLSPTTRRDGTFSSGGNAPATISSGLTVQAFLFL